MESTTTAKTKTNPEQSLDAADRLFKAIERGDIAAIREIYAPDAIIWHNNDDATQTVDANLALLGWVVANVSDIAYTEIRRHPTPTGFVQQHVMRGRMKSSGKELRLTACIICDVEHGRITRLNEYLDSAQVAVLSG
jgi:ketosteroid isomerase-like protein